MRLGEDVRRIAAETTGRPTDIEVGSQVDIPRNHWEGLWQVRTEGENKLHPDGPDDALKRIVRIAGATSQLAWKGRVVRLPSDAPYAVFLNETAALLYADEIDRKPAGVAVQGLGLQLTVPTPSNSEQRVPGLVAFLSVGFPGQLNVRQHGETTGFRPRDVSLVVPGAATLIKDNGSKDTYTLSDGQEGEALIEERFRARVLQVWSAGNNIATLLNQSLVKDHGGMQVVREGYDLKDPRKPQNGLGYIVHTEQLDSGAIVVRIRHPYTGKESSVGIKSSTFFETVTGNPTFPINTAHV